MKDQNQSFFSKLFSKIKSVLIKPNARENLLEEVVIDNDDNNYVEQNNFPQSDSEQKNAAKDNASEPQKSFMNFLRAGSIFSLVAVGGAGNFVTNRNSIAPLMFLPGILAGLSAGRTFAEGDKGLAAIEFVIAIGTTSLCLGVGLLPAFALTIVPASIGYLLTQLVDSVYKDQQPQNPVQIV